MNFPLIKVFSIRTMLKSKLEAVEALNFKMRIKNKLEAVIKPLLTILNGNFPHMSMLISASINVY